MKQKVPDITELGFDTIFHIKAINLAQSGCVENGIGQVTVEGLRMDFVPIHILDISL